MNDASPIVAAAMPFIDLQAQRRRLNGQIEAAIQRVVEHGQYILGPEVGELERQLAARVGAGHCILCSSGTDALLIAMLANDVGAGDAVLVPSFTFVASAEAVALAGATPIFVDVADDGFNIDVVSAKAGFERALALGLRPAALIGVDLFGLPADHDALRALADSYGALLIDDAAQSFGAVYRGRPVGTLADVTTTSFYPAKPLACYGDGGAVFTDDPQMAARIRSMSLHGQSPDRSEYVRVGINGRMDTIQAAIVLQKLTIFDDELEARQRVAERYRTGLDNLVRVPRSPDDSISVWAQYTITVDDRDRLARRLAAAGIPTAIYYARPVHEQPAYRASPRAEATLPRADLLATRVLSLPMHPYLDAESQDRIIDAIHAALA